jgi:hypothetical protein
VRPTVRRRAQPISALGGNSHHTLVKNRALATAAVLIARTMASGGRGSLARHKRRWAAVSCPTGGQEDTGGVDRRALVEVIRAPATRTSAPPVEAA